MSNSLLRILFVFPLPKAFPLRYLKTSLVVGPASPGINLLIPTSIAFSDNPYAIPLNESP